MCVFRAFETNLPVWLSYNSPLQFTPGLSVRLAQIALEAAIRHSLFLFFPLFQGFFAPPEVDIRYRYVPYPSVIAPAVVELDKLHHGFP